ncbi:hypothetical protein Micbo1qcDRAFT_231265 [Microdochium bolleyi]|uniref:MARVEL domain-containing protein n=1 Tax=Microdochium bolleyi TaxID=196109 RepID=A0A136JG70_9PEZI|nr:hypothetical protein Micbo1qcDRAFT_231265 [Microdochium bolleyi]
MDQPAAAQPAAQPVAQQQPVQQQPITASRHTATRDAGKEHIPSHPKGFIVLRILQLVFCLICIGLAGFVLSVIPYSSTAFMIFVCVVTLVMSIYNIVALTSAPKLYNYWAVLAFEIFLFVFWLIAFAWVAATAAVVLVLGNDYYSYYSYYYSSASAASVRDAYKALGSIIAAAAGIGALTWILYFVSFVMTAVQIHRHRSAGLHNRPLGAGAVGAAGAAAAVPAGGEKVEMQPQQPGQIYAQPSGYSQAPPYAPAPQQGFYAPQQSMSPPPQQQQQPQYAMPAQQYPVQQQQQYPQQYPQHSGQTYPQQPYQAVSNVSGDGSHSQVPAQTTGGSYVQGNPVAFPNATHENSQSPVHGQQQQQQLSGAPVHEAHGESYNPNAPRELQ